MIYELIDYNCDEHKVVGYTEDLDEAYKYSAIYTGCEIESIEKLRSDINYSQYEFVYHYIISFKFSNKTGKYEKEDFPAHVPECDYCECCIKNIKLYNSIFINEGYYVRFNIFIKERDLNLAYSTAEMYMSDLLSRGNGAITLGNIKAMNDEFSKEYREEQERLKAEKEHQNKIKAFEGKIRKLESDIKNKKSDLQKLLEEYEKELGSK